MGGRLRKKEQSHKRKTKNSRAKDANSKSTSQRSGSQESTCGNARSHKVTDLVVFNAEFSRRQKLLHCHTCVVCRRRDYFMKSCSRCQIAKCCNDKCLLKHCTKEPQRYICVNNKIFSTARKLIPPELKKFIFNSGYHEISPHIHSIPRREVYQLMGGPRSVILLQVLSAQVVGNLIQVFIQTMSVVSLAQVSLLGSVLRKLDCILDSSIFEDIDGFLAVLLFHQPADSQGWFREVMKYIPPQTFIMLLDCFWNNHAHRSSATVDVKLCHPLQQTQKIMKSIMQNEHDIIRRTLQKANRPARRHT